MTQRLIKPINIAELTESVRVMLDGDPNIGLAGTVVERAEPIKEEPQENGWIGVYKAMVPHPARVLGVSAGQRMSKPTIVIMVRQWNAVSGASCEDLLEALVQFVLGAIMSDTTLGGKVEMLDSIDVRYESFKKNDDDVFMQDALIYVTAFAPTLVQDI